MIVVLGSLAVLVAAFLGGVVGFAYGLVALPVLLVIGVPLPEVIVVNLVIGLVTRIGVVARLRRRIDVGLTALLVAGSLPGMGFGLLVQDAVSSRVIQLVSGVLAIGAAIAFFSLSPRQDPGPRGQAAVLGAGGLGGLLGVTTSLNGVPPALFLLRHRVPAASMVADLGAYFVIGNALTLAALGLGGDLGIDRAWPLLLAWVPAGVVGQSLGLALGQRVPQAVFGRLVLAVVLVSGLVSIVEAL